MAVVTGKVPLVSGKDGNNNVSPGLYGLTADTGWHPGAVCGNCAHFQQPSTVEKKGLCHGMPPAISQSGCLIERFVSRLRPACALYRKREATVDTAGIKATATEVARAGMELGLIKVTGSPATAAQLASRSKERKRAG